MNTEQLGKKIEAMVKLRVLLDKFDKSEEKDKEEEVKRMLEQVEGVGRLEEEQKRQLVEYLLATGGDTTIY